MILGIKMTKIELTSALDALSIEELSAHIAEAEALLGRKQNETRQAFIDETLQKAEKLGVSLEELIAHTVKPATGRQKKTPAEGSRKVPVKYRDPTAPENTWTGRGMKPRWIRKKLEDGATLEDFAV